MNSNKYVLYTADVSYYSGKMKAYLKYKEIPFESVEMTTRDWLTTLLPNTGMMKIPCMQTPDGRWMRDTTPMVEYLETQFTETPVQPEDPVVAFFSRLIEDYADEWMWRPALYYRWAFADDFFHLSRRIGKELVRAYGVPKLLGGLLGGLRQRLVFLKKDGVTEGTKKDVENTYLSTLDKMEAIFEKQPFLLGDKPCMADFGFFASMFRHFGLDPTPARIMRDRTPGVYEWVARMWNAKSSKLHEKEWNYEPGKLPDYWRPLMKDVCEIYLPYLRLNAVAFKQGKQKLDHNSKGTLYKDLPVIPYRVWCREEIHRHFNNLSDVNQLKVKEIFNEFGAWNAFIEEQDTNSNWNSKGLLPFCEPMKDLTWRTKVKYYFSGTPW